MGELYCLYDAKTQEVFDRRVMDRWEAKAENEQQTDGKKWVVYWEDLRVVVDHTDNAQREDKSAT